MDEVISFVLNNYEWLLPSFFSLLSFILLFFKKGRISQVDLAKVVTSQKVIASAMSALLEKEKIDNVEKTSKTKQEKV